MKCKDCGLKYEGSHTQYECKAFDKFGNKLPEEIEE